MDTLLIAFWSFFLCLIVAAIIITFPASFSREGVKKGSRKIQLSFITVDAVICIVALILHKVFLISIALIEMKIALMLIPVVACLIFSVFLYYPSIRFLVRENLDDQETMDSLLTCIFKCAYSDKDGSAAALTELAKICEKEESFIRQYGLAVYLAEYVNQTKYNANNKPSENTIHCVLDRCNQVKHDIDDFTPTPFPNIGLVLSFVFSTVLTVLLSIVTVAQ